MSQSLIMIFGAAGVTDNLTRFFPLAGRLVTASSEPNCETPVREAGVFSNLYARVSTNTCVVGTAVLTMRVNQADAALTVSYGPTETGVKQDTTHTVAVANTDEAAWKVVVPSEAGTTTITFSAIGVTFAPTDTSLAVVPLAAATQLAFATASDTRFVKINGVFVQSSVESNEKFRVRNAGTLYGLSVLVSANARTTNTVFTSRLNGAAGAQTVTFGNIETGRKENAGSTDTLVAGDDINYALTTSTGTGTITMQSLGCMYKSTNGTFPLVLTTDGNNQAFNVTNYWGVAGDLDQPTLTESVAQIVPSFTFTAKELSAFVSSNSITTSPSVIRLRVAGADGTQSLSYAAAETGVKSDSVNTDVITGATSSLNYRCVTPNTSGTLALQWIALWGEVAAGGGGTVVPVLMAQYRQRRHRRLPPRAARRELVGSLRRAA